METLRKFYSFFVICIAVFATIGCTAYLFYFHKPLFAVACLCLAGMATPYVVSEAKKLFK